jgi:hypothetical protein
MGDTEKFIISAVLLGVVASEARDLPTMIEKWQNTEDESTRQGILLRWVCIAAIVLFVLSFAFARKVAPANVAG